MKSTSRFRIFGVGITLVTIALVFWQLMPAASAQKDISELNPPTGNTTPPGTNDDEGLILLNAAHLDVNSPELQADRGELEPFSGKRMHLVRFSGPTRDAWYKMLTDTGVEVITYIPNYSYLVYGNYDSLKRLRGLSRNAASPIVWDGGYKDFYKVNPDVYAAPESKERPATLRGDEFSIQLYKDEKVNEETFELVEKLKTKEVKGRQEVLHYVNFVVGLSEDGMRQIAARPDVVSIFPYIEPRKMDERQNFILRGNLTGNSPTPGDWLAYLASKGYTQTQFDTSNFAVDITDSGVDVANPAAPNQFVLRRSGDPALASRFIYSRLEGTPHSGSTLQGCDGHGNLNTTIIAGYVPTGGIFAAAPHADANGFRYGMGIAPFVKIGSSVIFDPSSFTNPNFPNLQSKAYNDGARISSNSWGASTGGAYTSDSQAYDALVRDAQPTGSTNAAAGNQEMVIVFAAGNDGSGANTVGSPGTGKNVITAGASENVNAFGGADQCGTTDAQADSAMDIVPFSSRGPMDDGRVKPDIMLPGTHVTGGVAQNTLVSPVSGTGTALTCFDATGVCAGPGTSNFFPLGQQWYTASSGTSHSTPAISGYSALIRQDFINRSLTAPSPAMTKAIMMNSTEYMTGTGANDNLPSNNQGMGLADMDRYFDIFAQTRILRDQNPADTFSDTGQARAYTGTIVDNTKPFRVTLAWTDVPGPTSGNAFVNNLDLEVTAGGVTYKGNVFTGGASSAGGAADTRNNVESVFVPAGVTGPVAVIVRATNIAGDGLPDNADPTDQDYALVVSNVLQGNSTVLSAATPVVTTGNGLIEPSESNQVNITLSNIGNVDATAVSSVLSSSTSGVTITQPNSAYSTITQGGGSQVNTTPFGVSTNSSIAFVPSISLTLTVNYTGGGSPGVFNFTVPVARPSLSLGTPAVTSGNNVIEPNECNTVNLPVNNGGNAPATAVNAVLSTTTPGVSITGSNSAYANIAGGGSGSNTTPFQISTDSSIACLTNIALKLVVTNTGGPTPVEFNFTMPVGQAAVGYVFTSTTGPIPGTPASATLIPGSQVDDDPFNMTAPFAFSVYGTNVAAGSTIRGGANGNIQIVSSGGSTAFTNTALPASTFGASTPTLMPYWDDLIMTTARFATAGVYEQTLGSAPNRQWVIEWRAQHFSNVAADGMTTNFAVVFNEGSNNISYVYALTGTGGTTVNANGASATVGIQSVNSGTNFTQFSFNQAVITNTLRLNGAIPTPVCSQGAGQCASAPVEVSGKVVTSGGRAIGNAVVFITDGGGVNQIVRSSSFGYFRFVGIPRNANYTVSINMKRYTFTPQNINTNSGAVTGLSFTASP